MNKLPAIPSCCFSISCALAGLALLAGCAAGPDFQPPVLAIPAQWSGQTAAAGGGEAASLTDEALGRWWDSFHDPLLTSLEKRALAENLDLKLAEARIRQARAARLGAGAGLGPTVEATAQYRRSRSVVNASQAGSTATGVIDNLYQAGFDTTWELDLFGRVRRGIEAADADLLAAAEAGHGAMVSLTAEVATTYLGLRAQQQNIQTARKNLAAQEQTVELTRQLRQAGFRSSLDVAAAEAEAATMRAQVPPLESAARQAMHSLAILLGREPAALAAELAQPAAIPAAPMVPAGLPSDLLRRRPDIRQAEAQIHAATARIGVAEAELFPKFSLSAVLNFQGAALDSWFNWTHRLWSLGPAASWQLFDSGRTRANVLQQQSLQEQSLIIYQQTVLTALREVEDALVAVDREQEHHAALLQAQEANQKTLDLATTLYTAGQADFLNVLQAERAVYATDDALTQSTRSLAINLVALYKALGGGWEVAAR